MSPNVNKKLHRKEFSARLRRMADEQGYSAASLAKRLRTRRQTVDHWFKGRNLPSPKYMRAIAEAFGVNVQTLKYGPTLLSDEHQPSRSDTKSTHDTPSPPPESTKSPGHILTGTVAQERRSPWHPDPRKNELLRMAAFVLEADDPEITPAFEQEIIKAHNALVRGRHPKPEAKKAINQS